MNTNTSVEACLKGVQNFDTTHRTTEQVYPVSKTSAKLPDSISEASKATLKFLSSNCVYSVPNSSLFIDTRKQENFDWQKNTNVYQRIIHLSDLEDKWDGYNAPKFSKEQIDLALTLYSNLRTYCIERGLDFSRIEPFIAPCSDGMVLFEWAGKRFPFKQLEIYIPSASEDILEYLKTGENLEIEGEFRLEELYSILDWLFKFDC